MPFLPFIISGAISYKLCNIFTNPNSNVWKRLPRINSKRVDFFPSIRIKIKGRIIHFHHWFNYSVLLGISIFVQGGVLDSWAVRGFLMGGVIQGLLLPVKKMVYKEELIAKVLK
jgi:hypothetical protein